MVATTIEAFSVSHAQILDGSTEFTAADLANEAQDVYGVNESSLDPNIDDYDNEGDDVVLSTWSWMNYADLSVQAGYVSFPLIASLTSQTVSSSAAGAAIFGVDLWHEDHFNVAPKPMVIRCPARDKDGNTRHLVIGLYKVQFRPITFDGPRYKDGLKVNYAGRALYSTNNELSAAFADGKKRIAKLLSTP